MQGVYIYAAAGHRLAGCRPGFVTGDLQPRPVFLTGLPRCGSSWAGQVLSIGGRARYLYEPFNHQWNRRLRGALKYLEYVPPDADGSHPLQRAADAAFSGRQTARHLLRAAYRGYWRSANRHNNRLLIKDPTACLLAGWLSGQYNPLCVVVYRHPCGFASSVAQLGWNFRVNRLFRQPKLMAEHLEPFESVMRASRDDPWLSRGALWGAVHRVLLNQAAQRDDWRMISYEQLCLNPQFEFSRLAEGLGMSLRLTGQMFSAGPQKTATDPGSTRRDSHRMPDVWKQRLSPLQADAVLGAAREFQVDDLLHSCTISQHNEATEL